MDTLLSKIQNLDKGLYYLIVIAIAILSGIVAHWILFKILEINQEKFPTVSKAQLIKYLKTPAKFLFPLFFIYGAFSTIEISSFWKKVAEILIIINFTWVLLALAEAIEGILKDKFKVDEDNAEDRNVLTQFKYLKRVVYVIIIVLGVALIL